VPGLFIESYKRDAKDAKKRKGRKGFWGWRFFRHSREAGHCESRERESGNGREVPRPVIARLAQQGVAISSFQIATVALRPRNDNESAIGAITLRQANPALTFRHPG
jgi:hypothetical protein